MSNGGCKAGRANEEKARGFAPESLSAPWKDLGEEEKKKAKERYAAIYGAKGKDEAQPMKPAIADAIASDTQPKKEEKVATAKERILSRILREGKCNRGRLANYCAVSSEEMTTATAELEKEGKIKSWPNGRSCFYTPPGAADPWTDKGVAVQKKTASAAPRAIAPARKLPGKVPPKNGGGRTGSAVDPLAAVLADLEARRQNIDNAIAALKALR